MAAVHLGDANCPLCGCFGARVSLSKNGLAVLTCNSSKCRGMQMFARSPGSDEMIRDRIGAAPAPVPTPEPEPVRTENDHEKTRYEEHREIATETAQAGGMGLLKSWF